VLRRIPERKKQKIGLRIRGEHSTLEGGPRGSKIPGEATHAVNVKRKTAVTKSLWGKSVPSSGEPGERQGIDDTFDCWKKGIERVVRGRDLRDWH